MISLLQDTLCETQAELFLLSGEKGYDSKSFIEGFMKSSVARDMDREFSHTHWAGTAYLMDRLETERGGFPSGEAYAGAQLEWIGYIYRFWHFYTGESSALIYRQANADVMRNVYFAYHTLGNELAVQKLKERYNERYYSRRERRRMVDVNKNG